MCVFVCVCVRVCACVPPEEGCGSRQLCGGNQAATERMIQFGRELQGLNEQLCREYGKNATHKKMLQVGGMGGEREGGGREGGRRERGSL